MFFCLLLFSYRILFSMLECWKFLILEVFNVFVVGDFVWYVSLLIIWVFYGKVIGNNLVYNEECIWFKLFLVGYYNYRKLEKNI